MKNLICIILILFISPKIEAQIQFIVDSIEIGIPSKVTGNLEYKTEYSKKVIEISDKQIILTDHLGKRIILRVFSGQADILTQIDVNPRGDIFLKAINDHLGEFWEIHYSTSDIGEKNIHMSSCNKLMKFYGKEK